MSTVTALSSPMSLQLAITVELPDDLVDLEKKIRRKLPGALRRIANEGKSFWKSEAGRRLKSSRNAYQKGIDFKIVDERSFYLLLEGFIPYSVEQGQSAFDMKPGFLANAKAVGKRKFPRAVAATLNKKANFTKYRIIPLNVNRYIKMQKPKVYRTVTDKSPASSWTHPGFKGVHIADAVVKELNDNIIPKHLNKLLGEP